MVFGTPFSATGDLPAGVHRATLDDVVERFGQSSSRRRLVAQRLHRIHAVAVQTGHLARFVVFGSFVTAKPEPNDVDVFMLMDDGFDASTLRGETAILFDHVAAQAYFGASVFWLRRLAVLAGEQAAIEDWQIKRDGTLRGIVEVMPDDQK
jgi:hypothetical protein